MYFYLRPSNTISKKIKDNLNVTGHYRGSSNDPYDIYEQEFDNSRDHSGYWVIPLPPFESVEDVSFYPKDDESRYFKPKLIEISKDHITIEPTGSREFKDMWFFRIRG